MLNLAIRYVWNDDVVCYVSEMTGFKTYNTGKLLYLTFICMRIYVADIDECRQWEVQGGKLCFGDCRNTMGSYECQCPQGYNMDPDGRSCRVSWEIMQGELGDHAGELEGHAG